jgi:hypothetical protein
MAAAIYFSAARPYPARAGIIFYPGGWVDFHAYEALMYELADRGFLCILVREPENLAFLDTSRANKVRYMYPDIPDWYLAGHSLGGAAADMYLGDKLHKIQNDNKSRALSESRLGYKGLILLASYVTKDLSRSGLKILSIYGTNDKVLNRRKYEQNKKNWPADAKEIKIKGGIHSYFGAYGIQKHDGHSEITNEEQLIRTADAIYDFAK